MFTAKRYFALFGVFSVLTYLSSAVFSLLGTKHSAFLEHATYFYGMQRIPSLLISLTLFMAFATLLDNQIFVFVRVVKKVLSCVINLQLSVISG